MLENNHSQSPQNGAGACDCSAGPYPPRDQRLPLKTAENVRSELARIYRDAKTGKRDVSDVSKLANILQIMARLIETSDIEARLEKLENSNQP